MVAEILSALSSAWGDTSAYECACANNRTGFACCNPDVSNWLPPALNTLYQPETVQADQALHSLTGQLQTFYRRALEDLSVWTHYLDEATLDG